MSSESSKKQKVSYIPLSDEDIMRRRLLFDGEGVGDEKRLQIILKYMFELANSVNKDPKEQEVLQSRAFLLLDDSKLSMKRSMLTITTNDRELRSYEHIMKNLESEIESTKDKILKVKEELQRAKSIRKNRLEYEPIVNKVEKLPSRKESLDRIEKVKNETKMLEEKRIELQDRLEQRKQEIQSLAAMAQNLLTLLNADETLALEDLPDDIPPTEGPTESQSK